MKKREFLWYALFAAILIGGLLLPEYSMLCLGLCYLLMVIYLITQVCRKKMTLGRAVAFVVFLIVVELLRR